MKPLKAAIPATSVLDQQQIEAAFFNDCYRVDLAQPQMSVVAIFFSVFGHRPRWMNNILIIRNTIAAACGLDVPKASDIRSAPIRSAYEIGDLIGPWPIFHISDKELVAGRDNRHLDFRLSILKVFEGETASAYVSTVCKTHNIYGKFYLLCIIPFHRWGVQWLLRAAIAAKRL